MPATIVVSPDAFVMPTRNGEAFGRTIVESLARGTPVLGSDNGAVPELLQRR